MRIARCALLGLALLGAACTMARGELPDEPSAAGNAAPPGAAATPAEDAGASPSDASPRDAGSAPPDAATAPCDPQTVTWSQGNVSCAATSGALAAGASQTLTDAVGPATGTVSVTCTGGILLLKDELCAPPQVLDVLSPTGCVRGYCSSVISGVCASTDTNKALAICKYKGFNALSASTITSGPLAAECNADGSSCFQNANASCNTVFKTVTCTY